MNVAGLSPPLCLQACELGTDSVAAHHLRQQILQGIEKLPDERLSEVLDFVDFLISRQRRGEGLTATNPAEQVGVDPMLSYMGGVEHGALAQDIEKDLFGQ